MPHYTKCVYHNCGNKSTDISMFRFPVHDEARLLLWKRNSGNIYLDSLTNEELRRRYICAAHFLPSSIHKGSMRSRLILPAVPIHYQSVESGEGSSIPTMSAQSANVDIDIEEIQIKLEPEIKFEVLKSPEELPDTECPLFEPCTRRMLPRVGMFAIVQYLIQHGLFYDLLDFDKLKEDNEDLYADDTIHHVQTHKNKATVTLQCTVAFNRTTSHTCLMKYNVYTKCIENTRCECGQQACEHIIALLMWTHRRAEERIDNDMPL